MDGNNFWFVLVFPMNQWWYSHSHINHNLGWWGWDLRCCNVFPYFVFCCVCFRPRYSILTVIWLDSEINTMERCGDSDNIKAESKKERVENKKNWRVTGVKQRWSSVLRPVVSLPHTKNNAVATPKKKESPSIDAITESVPLTVGDTSAVVAVSFQPDIIARYNSSSRGCCCGWRYSLFFLEEEYLFDSRLLLLN